VTRSHVGVDEAQFASVAAYTYENDESTFGHVYHQSAPCL
jgi:hypothetical protein